MGYESKLIVVKKYDDASSFGEVIAELNLCRMPNEFFPVNEIFEFEVEQPVVINGKEEIEDCYGEKLRYGSVDEVLKALYKCEYIEHYRRTELAINTLKTFHLSKDWEDGEIVVVHYGY